jgi:hypothetical protein
MGLDMYLKASKYVSGWKHNKETKDYELFNKLAKELGIEELVCKDSPSVNIDFTVCYWRKANAIHQWFVDNVQDGKDECQTSDVSREQIKELIDICKQVSANHSLASNLLPTSSGFFFGGTDYSEYYFADLEDTITQLVKVLAILPEGWYLEYHTSW